MSAKDSSGVSRFAKLFHPLGAGLGLEEKRWARGISGWVGGGKGANGTGGFYVGPSVDGLEPLEPGGTGGQVLVGLQGHMLFCNLIDLKKVKQTKKTRAAQCHRFLVARWSGGCLVPGLASEGVQKYVERGARAVPPFFKCV